MTAPTLTETRIVCDECGQQQGLFHKGCSGAWVRQARTVTAWETVGPEPEFGGMARAAALAAGDPDWMNATRWPR